MKKLLMMADGFVFAGTEKRLYMVKIYRQSCMVRATAGEWWFWGRKMKRMVAAFLMCFMLGSVSANEHL